MFVGWVSGHQHVTPAGGSAGRRGVGRRWIAATLSAFVVVPALVAIQATTTAPAQAASPVVGQVTRGGDTHRTNWYPDQPNLSPPIVGGTTFGQLFTSPQLVGQIYAQPIVANGVLIIVTEANYIYGLNPESGAIIWQRNFGNGFDPRSIGCPDLVPTVGITSTPVVDTTTNTVYVVNKEYVTGTSGATRYRMHALNVTDGLDRPNFPVTLDGNADNRPTLAFNPTYQSQRPGLLLLGGRVYVAFSAHCQVPTWSGWIMGVDGSSGAVTARWADHDTPTPADSGGGIWMSGGGLASDGPGQIVFAIGNALKSNAGAYDRNNPPADLSNAVARLTVQANGSLKLTDFFRPESEAHLDANDLDLGSGGVALLPEAQFGAGTTHPHLAVAGGKEGYVYLLDRDDLGGEANTGGIDRVVGRYGPNGGIWSAPSVWPGDGGWVYVPTAGPGNIAYGQGQAGALTAYKYGTDLSNNPTLRLNTSTTEAWGFGSSNVVVTSTGTTNGSALVWAVHSVSAGSSGGVPNAELVAYDAVPSSPTGFTKVWSAAVGTTTKFTPPGIGPNGRVYVGTYDGHVLGFGAPLGALLSTTAVAFPDTTVAGSSVRTVSFAAAGTVKVAGFTTSAPFSFGTPQVNGVNQPLPVTLTNGQVLTVPVTFAPTVSGARVATLAAHVFNGVNALPDVAATLSGTSIATSASLSASTPALDLGNVVIGTTPSSNSVTFTNIGQAALTISSVTAPVAPFSATGLPVAGSTLAGGASFTVTLSFAPTAGGSFTGNIAITSSGGNKTIALSGTAAPPGHLTITPSTLDYGNVPPGTSKQLFFVLKNDGGSTLYFTVSKAPAAADFHADTPLGEGTALKAGASLVKTVTFAPKVVGSQSDVWSLTPTTGQNVMQVHFVGTSSAAVVPVSFPTLSGRAQTGLRLTVLPGTWGTAPSSPAGATTFTYQWLRNGKAIAGATAAAYTIAAADVGTKVAAAVTAKRAGYADGRAVTPAVSVSAAPMVVVVRPRISTSALAQRVFGAVVGTWSPSPARVTYQWLRDGKALTGVATTRSRIALGPRWRGHKLSVRITVSRAGYLTTTVVTAALRVR